MFTSAHLPVTLALVCLAALTPRAASAQPERAFTYVHDARGVESPELATGEEDGQRALLPEGARLTLELSDDATLVTNGTAQPDLYIRAHGEGSYRVELGTSPRRLSALPETGRGMSAWELDALGVREARFIRITALDGALELDSIHGLRIRIEGPQGTSTLAPPNARSFDALHAEWRVREATQALGAPDGRDAWIEPGGILSVELIDRAFVAGDGGPKLELEIHARGEGAYEVWASDDHESYTRIAGPLVGSTGLDLDASPLSRIRFLRLLSVDAEAPVRVDAVTARRTEVRLPHVEPNPLSPTGRWLGRVAWTRGVRDAERALGAEDGRGAHVAPGGAITVELDDLMTIRADGTSAGDLYIKAAEDGARYAVELSAAGFSYRTVQVNADGALLLDLDRHGFERARFVRVTNTSDRPLTLDALLALDVTPHDFHPRR